MMGANGRYPLFADLPTLATGERHVWDVFGRADEFGCLNFLDATTIVAAGQEITLGRVVNLNLPLGEPQPQFWASRESLQHHEIVKRNLRDDYLDGFAMQGSTQWDGLRHQRYREFGYYGGRQEEQLDSTGELGIDRWAQRGIVGRGVLVDVAGHLDRRGEPLAPDRRFPIGGELMDKVLEAQGTVLADGDILLLRTGWLNWYRSMEDNDRAQLAARLTADRSAAALPGIDPALETVGWLWDHRIAALAVDNPTAETLPYRAEEGWAHHRLLPLLGLPLGELWWLEELATVCEEAGRYTFFLSSAPLYLPGGAGSPANAYAVL